jgi:hypothetical protein
MFNSFVIADEEQARLIAAMKLPQLFCDPTRCKVPPLLRQEEPPGSDPEAAAEKERLAALAARRMAEKRARAQVMSELRERLDKAQQHYLGAAREVSGAIQGFLPIPARRSNGSPGSARTPPRRCLPIPIARSC